MQQHSAVGPIIQLCMIVPLQAFVLVGTGRVGTALADLGSGSDVRAHLL